MTATGLELLSSFRDYQFDAIISAIEAAEIPYRLEFSGRRNFEWFNLFVAEQYIDQTVQISTEIEAGETIYDRPLSIAKYNAAKSKLK
ncbi:MAG: hypothetical protein QQW96_03965 [Tychonema bourrellyi B0820]|nr:hypothetical protein [Tychonema bourrellyi B0820]PJE45205.1 MAG: hypothetical protein CUR32_00985 [Flavobacterium sp.] [Flavobacterium sp. FEMGT703F]